MAGNGRSWLTLSHGGHDLALDLALGNLRQLSFDCGDRKIRPLHSAPWLDDPAVQNDETLLPIERNLAGCFFCAPFGASDVEGGPAHGWSANSAWTAIEAGENDLRLVLDRRVMGARIEKRLRLTEEAPILYQTHLIEGGAGELTVAHHPMVRSEGAARLSVSPKQAAMTPPTPLEPGRHHLAYPAQRSDLGAFPTADGGTCDLREVPFGQLNEDFVTLVEAPCQDLGWTALIREVEDDLIFILKDPAVLPVTMLWMSNGGRDYPPWSRRHTRVLGIEDGCTAGMGSHAQALGDNPVRRLGVKTALALGGGTRHRVAHVIGAMPRPAGWWTVRDIAIDQGRLTLTEAGGATLTLPIDPDFLS
ncbi:MAG: hypothetical protein ACFB6S_11115 [Geminicoccaceae bacterium]